MKHLWKKKCSINLNCSSMLTVTVVFCKHWVWNIPNTHPSVCRHPYLCGGRSVFDWQQGVEWRGVSGRRGQFLVEGHWGSRQPGLGTVVRDSSWRRVKCHHRQRTSRTRCQRWPAFQQKCGQTWLFVHSKDNSSYLTMVGGRMLGGLAENRCRISLTSIFIMHNRVCLIRHALVISKFIL